MFGSKGELKHLTFDDNEGFGPDFEPLAKVLKELSIEATVICESRGTQTKDAVKMKNIRIFLTILVIIPLFSTICYAEDAADKYISEFEEAVPDGIFDGDLDSSELQSSLGIDSLISELVSLVSREKGSIVGFFMTLVGMLVLLSAASAVSGSLSTVVSAAVGTVVSVSVFSSVYGIFSSVSSAISEANEFFASIIPISVGITSLGGGTFVAGVQATGMAMTAAAISKLWGTAFTAVSGLGLSMSLLSSYGGNATASVSKYPVCLTSGGS